MAAEPPVRPVPWWRAPVAQLIVLFGLVLTAAAWLDVEHEIATDRRDERGRIERENDALARSFEEHVRRALLSADNALLFLQHLYQERQAVSQEMVAFAERTKRDPLLNQISVADAGGDLVLSAVPHAGRINISQREHFQVHATSSAVGLFVGKPLITKASGTWSFFLSRRLSRLDGSFAGVVSVGLSPDYFAGFSDQPSVGSGRSLLLIGRDGFVRAGGSPQEPALGRDLRSLGLFRVLESQPRGHYEGVGGLDQRQRFVSYRALPDFPVVVAVSEPSASALAAFGRRRVEKRLSALIFTLFVGLFSAMLLRAERRTHRQNAQLTAELAERRLAEEALQESQGLFAAFLDHVPAVVFVQDLRGQVLYANEAYRELPERETIGRNARELLLAPGGGTGGKGEPVLRGHSVALDETITDAAGETRIFETRMFVVPRPGKEPLLGCVAVDGTSRRQAEQQRLIFERRMQQNQKLESLGVLAGGVAHDFNNLLMVILGNTDLALARTAAESPVRAQLRNIDAAAQRAADLTNQMLAYSGKGRFVIESINISRLVQEMGGLLAPVISAGASLEYRLAPDVPPVLADATQIRQIIMNLITNASDAIGDNPGTITISTRVVELEAGETGRGTLDHALPPGRYVACDVADTGRGMDARTQARIFEPFFTTKHTGRGLGLASVLGIVQGHGGGIRVFSRPGKGTTFSVLLPVAPEAAAAPLAPEAASAPEPAGGGRPVVLLVDDEDIVRTTAQAMLEDSGFAVITARDGLEGVELFRAHHGALSVVLLDVLMPGLGGEEAFRQMRAVDPAVPVLLMSGFDEHEAAARLGGEGLAGFIHKPYRLKALLEKIREAAAGRPPRPA